MLKPDSPKQEAEIKRLAARLRKAGWISGLDVVFDDDVFLDFTPTGRARIEDLGRAKMPLRNHRIGCGPSPSIGQRYEAARAKWRIHLELAKAGALRPYFTAYEWEWLRELACVYTLRWQDETQRS